MNGFLDYFDKFLVGYNEYIGQYLLLAFLIPTGIYFVFKFKFLHVTKFFHSLRVISGKFDNPDDLLQPSGLG